MSDVSPTPAATTEAAPKGILARYWWVVGLAIAGVIAALAAASPRATRTAWTRSRSTRDSRGPGRTPASRSCPATRSRALDGTGSTIIAGIVGIAIVFLLVFLLGRLLARRRKGAAA